MQRLRSIKEFICTGWSASSSDPGEYDESLLTGVHVISLVPLDKSFQSPWTRKQKTPEERDKPMSSTPKSPSKSVVPPSNNTSNDNDDDFISNNNATSSNNNNNKTDKNNADQTAFNSTFADHDTSNDDFGQIAKKVEKKKKFVSTFRALNDGKKNNDTSNDDDGQNLNIFNKNQKFYSTANYGRHNSDQDDSPTSPSQKNATC